MSHKSVYGHDEDRVIDPATFQSFCRACNNMWTSVTSEEIQEIHQREQNDEAYDRAMDIV